jgi:integrase/recombinase XerD
MENRLTGEMVRDTGFEPVTPTVSKWGSGLKFIFHAGILPAIHGLQSDGDVPAQSSGANIEESAKPSIFFHGNETALFCVEEIIKSKRLANRRERYIKSLEYYLRTFIAGRENQHIATFDFVAVESWLNRYPAAYTRQTWLNRLSTLFSFAIRRGFITANPCDRVERVSIDHKTPVILTPQQTKLLFSICPTVCKPYLALAVYAGIRPEEIMRLNWEEINLETATAKVSGKTRQRRIVPLEPILVKILQEHPIKKGPVAPSLSTVRRFLRRARTALNLSRWPQDVLRHTAASYLLAKYQDAAKVALWLGNSPKILMRHYHNPVTAEDSEKFWTIFPH